MTQPVINILNLSVYDGKGAALVDGVSFSVPRGGAFVLIGETGSGKSLVAQAVLGLLPEGLIARGRVNLGDQAVDFADRATLQGFWFNHLAFVPQEPRAALDPTMRVLRQVAGIWRPAKARAAMASVSLHEAVERQYPYMLSGGMAQRALVASALTTQAAVVLADEPTKGLDDNRVEEAVSQLRQILEDVRAVIAITHDIRVARGLGGHMGVMREGRLLEHGPVDQVIAAPLHPYTRAWLESDPDKWCRRVPSAPTDAVLTGNALSYRVADRTLFEDLSLAVHRRRVTAIVGPSGSGKTMLGNVLLGLARPHAGHLRWLDGTVPYTDRRPKLRSRYQKLHQDPASAFAPRRPLRQQFVDLRSVLPPGYMSNELPALLERLRVNSALLERRPEEVSGGELQRLALARVLLFDPYCLVADEPTSRLDPLVQRDVMNLLCDLVDERGMALILTSHDRRLVRAVADDVVELKHSSEER